MSDRTLSPHHLAMLREGSGITDEVIAARGYCSIDGAEGYGELKRLTFSRTQANNTPGLLIPLWTTTGEQPLSVYRPDAPYIDAEGKPHKYVLPPRSGMRIDCPPRCRSLLGDPNTPLWWTEGQKKADCLASMEQCAIALLGVDAWRGKNQHGGITALPDLEVIAWNGREVRLVYDSDTWTKPSIRKSLDRATRYMEHRGATVRHVVLPQDNGKKLGVDDFIAQGRTLADLEACIDAPPPKLHPAPAGVELLDEAPLMMSRPLALLARRAYAAIWPHVKVTRTEDRNKAGDIVRLNPPEVTTEQRLFVVRDDGVIFGAVGGDAPLAALGVDVRLPDIPSADKLWTVPGVKAYRAGARPDPADVFRRLVNVVDCFLDFDRSLAPQKTMCELVACYILSTWFLDALNVVGYLWPNGGAGSGKTKLLTVVAELGYLGHVILAGGSYASLRDLADYGATLCFDDAENVMDIRRGDPDKRALLLAGNRRGNTISIKEPVNGREWRTRHVRTFCPRLFSAIRLPDTVLASRTIIVPLIRTADPKRGNAEVLEYGLWPSPRETLMEDLWALALRHLASIPQYEAQAVAKATMVGRLFEPWRGIFAVARWLQDQGSLRPTGEADDSFGLVSRMDTLATAYQTERPTLEPESLTPLVLQALAQHCATSAACATSATSIEGMEDEEHWIMQSSELKEVVVALASESESSIKPDNISTDRIGRVLGSLRFPPEKRERNRGPRKWRITLSALHKALATYGIPLSEDMVPRKSGDAPLPPYPPSSGASGTSGASGAHDDSEPPSTYSIETSGDAEETTPF